MVELWPVSVWIGWARARWIRSAWWRSLTEAERYRERASVSREWCQRADVRPWLGGGW